MARSGDFGGRTFQELLTLGLIIVTPTALRMQLALQGWESNSRLRPSWHLHCSLWESRLKSTQAMWVMLGVSCLSLRRSRTGDVNSTGESLCSLTMLFPCSPASRAALASIWILDRLSRTVAKATVSSSCDRWLGLTI